MKKNFFLIIQLLLSIMALYASDGKLYKNISSAIKDASEDIKKDMEKFLGKEILDILSPNLQLQIMILK